MTEQFTYAASGVDIDAGERAVTLMKAAVERTLKVGVAWRPRSGRFTGRGVPA